MQNSRYFLGKTILLTGASMGIGRELAIQLAREGANLILVARQESLLRQLCEEIQRCGHEITYECCDLSDDNQVQDLIVKLSSRHRLDGIIHNAGIGIWEKVESLARPETQRLFQVNFFSVLQLTQGLFPLLQHADTPRVLFISSVVSWRAIPGMSVYCASKSALNAFAEALRVEWAPQGIKVINVYPGRTRTEFMKNAQKSGWKEPFNQIAGQRAETVAKKTIRAYKKARRDEYISLGNRLLIATNFFWPKFLDWGLKRFFRRNLN